MSTRSSLAAAVMLAAAGAVSASAESNLSRVEVIYSAFAQGDIPAILGQMAEDVSWDEGHEGTVVPMLEPRSGAAGVADFFASLAALEFRKFEILSLFDGGAQVAALIDFDVVVKATGRPVVDQEMHLWSFGPDGKVTAFRHFTDTEEFARAVTP